MAIPAAGGMDGVNQVQDLVGFFFQAEDGIRDKLVTGVQTCALPISSDSRAPPSRRPPGPGRPGVRRRGRAGARTAGAPRGEAGVPPSADREAPGLRRAQIGRASCRERVEVWVVGGSWTKKTVVNRVV